MLGYFEEHMLNMSLSQTPLRCIQVDLSTFGLDTYGLVYSMSNPLVENDINMLCLSTFRTANVLVRKKRTFLLFLCLFVCLLPIMFPNYQCLDWAKLTLHNLLLIFLFS